MSNYDFYTSARFNMSWNALKYKYENKIDSNEYSLYQLLMDITSSFCLSVGLDYKLCECLSIVHGFSFCDHGCAAYKVIEDFLEQNNLEYDINTIKCDITKRRISSVSSQPDDNFVNYVEEMFSNNVVTKEVKLVKECHRILKRLQFIKNSDIKKYYDLQECIIKDLKEYYLNKKDIIEMDLSKYIQGDIPILDDSLDENTRNDLMSNLTNLFNEYKDKYKDKSTYDILLIAISCFIDS